ncbi:MAG TPA: phytanoyl-CoA dioxygenase family protein [Acidimicrobiales bacterium]|nr:phytanoyl-CoA dioxygenase family protein [Acidimicrobiales bacterium]
MESGWACHRQAVDPEAVAAALDDLAALRTAHGIGHASHLVAAPAGWPHTDRLGAGLAALAAAMLGAPVACFAATYVVKPAGVGMPTRWHQDAPAWAARLEGRPAATVWLALTDADEANGCLEVVPGSHLGPLLPLEAHGGEPSIFGVASVGPLPGPPEALPATAGDAIVVDARLLHAAGPNRSAGDRVALALRYTTGLPVVAG